MTLQELISILWGNEMRANIVTFEHIASIKKLHKYMRGMLNWMHFVIRVFREDWTLRRCLEMSREIDKSIEPPFKAIINKNGFLFSECGSIAPALKSEALVFLDLLEIYVLNMERYMKEGNYSAICLESYYTHNVPTLLTKNNSWDIAYYQSAERATFIYKASQWQLNSYQEVWTVIDNLYPPIDC